MKVDSARAPTAAPPADEPAAAPDRQDRKKAREVARRQRQEAKAEARRAREEAAEASRREREEAKVAARKENEEAEAAAVARKEKQEAEAAARREKREAEAAARQEKRETEAAARQEKREAEAAAREEERAEAAAREARDQRQQPVSQALVETAAASATVRVEPDQTDDVVDNTAEVPPDAKASTHGDTEDRKTAKAAAAAAAEEKMRAKKEARKHRADAKQQAKAAKAQANREAKGAKLAAKDRGNEQAAGRPQGVRKLAEDARPTAVAMGGAAGGAHSISERALLEAAAAEETASTAIGTSGAVAGAHASERALVEAAEVEEVNAASWTYTTNKPEATDTQQDAAPDRSRELEATQPVGRVRVDDDVPDSEPAKERTGVRAAAIMVAALVGALGLIFSVVLAVGALTVAIGAGDGNSIYDPLSTVCDALVGPLKNAFSFTGPNAASREEFLGWGAGSLIYLAVSFAGQAAHRAATRD